MPISPKPPKIEISLNQVKLPTPSTSEYVNPLDADASSGVGYPLSDKELRVHSGGITNKPNIYDGNPATYANPTTDLAVGETRECIVWDLGKTVSCKVKYKIEGVYNTRIVKLYYSSDDVTYTLIDQSEGGVIAEGETGYLTFRYLKWEADNSTATTTGLGDYFRLYTLELTPLPSVVYDDDTLTVWQPYPVNEAGAWLKMDMGALKIVGAIRVYFPDSAYIPTFKIQTSEDDVTYEDVLTGQTGSVGWNEYTFMARYARYVRLVVEDYGTSSGIKIAEIDYWSRLVDRVASEHGHGSGITPHLKVRFSKGHPKQKFKIQTISDVKKILKLLGIDVE
jgi:hypothetical protein